MDTLSSWMGSAGTALSSMTTSITGASAHQDAGDGASKDREERGVTDGDDEDKEKSVAVDTTRDTSSADGEKKEELETNKSEGEGGESKISDSANFDVDKALTCAKGTAKEIGSFLIGFSKKATEAAVNTAGKVKHVVAENSLLGDFNKEQEKFLESKKSGKHPSDAALPPWVGYNDEENLKEHILALSKEPRNFLRNPPAGANFQFDYDTVSPVALTLLEEDPNLKTMRFTLVPKKVKEEQFWSNYFYRVSLIKQSSQLNTMLNEERDSVSVEGTGSSRSSRRGSISEEEGGDKGSKVSGHVDTPTQAEFASDAFDGSRISDEELKRGMQELGMKGEAQGKSDKVESPSRSGVKANESGVKANESGVKANESAVPGNESAVPGNESAVPANESAVPGNESAVPGNESAVPANESSSDDLCDDEWEEELQRELQEYELVDDDGDAGGNGGESGDPKWEKEIEELLEEK